MLILSSHYSLCWADYTQAVIKSTTNANEKNIGDYWIGEDFAEGLRALNLPTETEYRTTYKSSYPTDKIFSIYMRGYTDFIPPFPNGCNILYSYYPMAYHPFNESTPIKKEVPDFSNLDDDWQNFDLLTVASISYVKELQKNNIDAFFIPQFTNPQKFYPNPKDNLKSDILFVGSNWHDRTSLRYALESGFTVDIYGYNWKGIVPDEMYKADYIPNTELNSYYSSAKIVLNDHRPDMKKFGFVNNRIYDATAAGALVISDYMPEIEQFYGDSVPMYKNKEELKELLTYYLTHEDERLKKIQQARQITLDNFTNVAVAKKMLNLVKIHCPKTE